MYNLSIANKQHKPKLFFLFLSVLVHRPLFIEQLCLTILLRTLYILISIFVLGLIRYVLCVLSFVCYFMSCILPVTCFMYVYSGRIGISGRLTLYVP